MTRSQILGIAALLSAVGASLALPSEAQARRCCRRGYYDGTYSYGASYAAPAGSTCAPTTAPANPDGTMAPQPGGSSAPPPPAPAPQGALD